MRRSAVSCHYLLTLETREAQNGARQPITPRGYSRFRSRLDPTLPYPTSLSTCRKAIFSLVAVSLIFLARINVRESEADMLNYRPPLYSSRVG